MLTSSWLYFPNFGEMIQPLFYQFYHLASRNGGHISNIEGDRVYEFKTHADAVYSRAVDLGSGLHFANYKLCVKEDLLLDFTYTDVPAIYFIYCTQGFLFYKSEGPKSEEREIINLQAVIVGCSDNKLNIRIPEDTEVSFAIICLEELTPSKVSNNADSNLFNKVIEHFKSKFELNSLAYHSTLNLNIKSQLDTIQNIDQTGIARKMMIKGIVHCVLGLEIMNFEKDQSNELLLDTNLTKTDLLAIREAIYEVKKRPDFSFSVGYLCQNYMLSPQKLQLGFKTFTGKTVANYILEQRLLLAEELIKEGNLSISQIVYSVGLSSKSYFSKIFKNRFGCSPKSYANSQL